MNIVEEALRRIAQDLAAMDISWALVGGFAVSVRAEPRFTRDVDIAVAVTDDPAAERIVHSLTATGYRVEATIEHDTAGRLATVRLVPPMMGGGDVVVDLLFASSGIEPEIVDEAETIEVLSGLTLPVITVGHLLVTKLLARDDETRPQDAADLRALREVATPADFDQARQAIALVTARGFDRERDLAAALRALEAP